MEGIFKDSLNKNLIKIENPEFYYDIVTGKIYLLLPQEIEMKTIQKKYFCRFDENKLKEVYELNNVKNWLEEKDKDFNDKS